jgi:ergothioneine biosynthesis protein EgtB
MPTRSADLSHFRRQPSNREALVLFAEPAPSLAERFTEVRRHTLALAEPLSAEDQCVQSMPDASPTKWHLAHSTWFFETLVLQAHAANYRPFDERYAYLFNSYYEALGPRHPRPQRGLLTRPALAEVLRYRAHVDAAMHEFLSRADEATLRLIELGLHHEQQHQELLLTDVKHLLSLNPLLPAYLPAHAAEAQAGRNEPMRWLPFDGGRVEVGHRAADGFCFDNETPRHAVLLQPFELASRPVSCGDYLEFMQDGGYRDSRWWLSDGWAKIQAEGWSAPAYWLLDGEGPAAVSRIFTLFGPRALQPAEPVCHLSLYEAAAYAAWADARLPTEFEWESAVAASGSCAARRGGPHPCGAGPGAHANGIGGLHEVWEWTRSAYDPYPGFRPLSGAVSEYNGKFMVGQVVLRGGSCASPPGHVRTTYRNFFPPAARWQFSGLRLARDAP